MVNVKAVDDRPNDLAAFVHREWDLPFAVIGHAGQDVRLSENLLRWTEPGALGCAAACWLFDSVASYVGSRRFTGWA